MTTGLYSFSIQGDVAGFTTYTTRRGKAVMFPQAPPKQPPSPNQLHTRGIFSAAVWAWRSLSDERREAWQQAAHSGRAQMTGYNLLVQMITAQRTDYVNTIQRRAGIPLITAEGTIIG